VGTVTKDYDGTTVATLSPNNFLLTGKISSDNLYVNTTVGSYADASIATNKLVTLNGLTLAGSSVQLVNNYNLTTNSVSANIGVIYNNPFAAIPQTVLQQIIQAVLAQQVSQIISQEVESAAIPITFVPIATPSAIAVPLPSINPSSAPNIGIFMPSSSKATTLNNAASNSQTKQYQNTQYPDLGGLLFIDKKRIDSQYKAGSSSQDSEVVQEKKAIIIE
jgi:hypothetical protein